MVPGPSMVLGPFMVLGPSSALACPCGPVKSPGSAAAHERTWDVGRTKNQEPSTQDDEGLGPLDAGLKGPRYLPGSIRRTIPSAPVRPLACSVTT